jgi:hypothetical protein
MPILTSALVDNKKADELRTDLLNRLQRAKEYWRPLNARQDYWAMMYYMQDVIQQIKPVGHRRFISNEPHTAVDLAVSILTRNDAFWRIALFESANENQDERRLLGNIERTLQGIINDIDETFSARLKQSFWKQAAMSALLRGFIWGKVHITTDALKYKDTPIVAEMYDPRLVYPIMDQWGLNSVYIETECTLQELVNAYPDKFGEFEARPNYDPFTPVAKLEFWSNDRGEKKGMTGVLATVQPMGQNLGQSLIGTLQTHIGASEWVIEPYFHGYDPVALPVRGVAVNGVNLTVKPQLGELLSGRLAERAELLGVPSTISWWTGNNSHVAEIGRSILAAVEEHVPQYNELVATIMHHLAISAYGTWVFTSPSGAQPKFNPGIESKISLMPSERLDRMEVGPINADAFKLVQLLGDEKQNGMLANILRANTPFQGTGVLFQQMANAALNALEPYQDGMEKFGQQIAASIIAQLQMAGSEIKPFSVLAPAKAGASKRQSLWVVEFDPKELAAQNRRYAPRPVFKPSLPDDLAVRINAARLALDPRRPILSLTTVLEHILQVEDPTDEIDRIWEDIANTDPVLVFEQISAALRRMGENGLAEQIEEKQFREKFIQELEFKQKTGADIPAPNSPEALGLMPPEAGGGVANTATNEDIYGAGGGGPPQMGNEMGAMGMRNGV